MTEAVLKQTRIHAGVWQGLLTGAIGTPRLEALHLDAPLAGLAVAAVAGEPGLWAVHLPIPAQALSEGVQTFVIRNAQSGVQLAHFTVITGVALGNDFRAEMDLLRAELDLLKHAFRRHCVESAG